MDFADDDLAPHEQPFRLRQRAWPTFGRRRGNRSRMRRIALALVTLVFTLALFVACAGGLLLARLSRGPIAVNLEAQVSKALASRVKHGFKFHVGRTDVQSTDGRPALVVRELLVEDESGRPVIKAPQATLSVDPLQMLGGAIVPTRLDIHDVTVKLVILPDGDVALSAGTDERLPFRLSEAFERAAPGPAVLAARDAAPTGSISAPPKTPDRDAVERVAQALAPLLDQFTGADDAFGGFDRLGVARGTLVLDDRAHNSVSAFKNLDFEFDRLAEGGARMSLSAEGAAGRWSASVSGTRQADGRRGLSIEVQNVTLDQLRSVPGLNDPGFDTDMPVAGHVDIALDSAGALAGANLDVNFGSGYFKLNDPDHEPVMVTRILSGLRFDPASRTFVIAPSTLETDTASYAFKGVVRQPPAGESQWSLSAQGSGTVGPERPNEAPITLDRITAALGVDPGTKTLTIDNLDVHGPDVALAVTGSVALADDGPHIATRATAGRMPAPTILRLWPTTVSAAVRSWLLANLQAGTVEHGTAVTNLDEADLAKMKVGRSVADNHLRVDYAVSGVTLAFMKGVPALKGLSGTGVVTGDTSRFMASRGTMEVSPGHQLGLSDGSVIVPSTDPKPTPAVISAHVTGGVDVLSELLRRDALKSYAAVPAEAATARGQIDGTLSVGIDLGAKTKADDVQITANATIAGLGMDRLVGKQGLTDGNFTLALDKTGLHAKGNATVAGAPTSIDVKKPAGTGPGEADAVMTFDDAARAKAGLTFGKALSGPVTAKIVIPLGTDEQKASVDIDLSRASLSNLVPGLSKAAGRPGRITLVASQRSDGVNLDTIACDIGSFSVRGSADLDANGSFQSAKLTQARISPGDDMKIDASQTGDGMKLVVRSANLDARPFLKSLSDSDAADPGSKDLDLDLKANVLTGQNSQAMTGVDLKFVRHGGQIRKLTLNGKLGREPLTINSVPQGSVLAVSAVSNDAGASLDFLDLYKRLDGGRLEATVRMLNGRWDGTAVVRDFGLREDPAMKRLTEESLAQRKSGNDPHIDAGNLRFTKLFIDFSKSGSHIEVKDGALYSPQLGATVQGSIDFGHDKIALGGTFVPIYGVNNLFSQMPIVGPILGGGANEGLFGLNYKIVGSVAKPDLTIDPLSALAPGFLRKIFGAISEAAQDTAPTPGGKTAPDASNDESN